MQRLPSDDNVSAGDAQPTTQLASEAEQSGDAIGLMKNRKTGAKPTRVAPQRINRQRRLVTMPIVQAIDSQCGRQEIRILLKGIARTSAEDHRKIEKCQGLLNRIADELAKAPFHIRNHLRVLKLQLLEVLLDLLPKYNINVLTFMEEKSIALGPDLVSLAPELGPSEVKSEEQYFEDLGLEFN